MQNQAMVNHAQQRMQQLAINATFRARMDTSSAVWENAVKRAYSKPTTTKQRRKPSFKLWESTLRYRGVTYNTDALAYVYADIDSATAWGVMDHARNATGDANTSFREYIENVK